MTQPQSGISTRNLLVLGGLSALLATPAARARVLALLQGPLEGAQELFKETVAPTVQQAAQQALSRAGELGVDARKVAVHAAAQVQDGLPGLIDGVRGQASFLAENIAESTAELRSDLGERAAKAAVAAKTVAAKTAASVQGNLQERLGDVQESAGKRAHALLESAAEVRDDLSADLKKAELGKKVGELQASVQKKANSVADDVQDIAQDRLKDARKAVGLLSLGAAKAAEEVQEKVQKKVQVNVKDARVARKDIRKRALKLADNAQDEAQDRLKDVRKSAGKLEARARKEAAEQATKVKKHVAQTIDAAQESLGGGAALVQTLSKKEVRTLGKQGRVQLQAYQARVALLESELARSGDKTLRKLAKQKAPRSRGGTVFTLLLLVGGGVVLARVPAARQGILNGVGALSPEAEVWLRDAGRTVRNLIGTAWLERPEEPGAPVAAAAAAVTVAAPAPRDDQATASAAAGSTEPGAPAQAAPKAN